MPAGLNPYAARERVPGEAPGPLPTTAPHIAAYGTPTPPESTDNEYVHGAYATPLHPGPESVPSDIRVGLREPPPNDPNKPVVTYRREQDRFERQADEQTVSGWTVQQHKVPPGQDPLWTQERMHIRPTAVRSPYGYLFSRYWHIPRNIKDAIGEDAVAHISMADHRREYDIMGMRPSGKLGVNTFRLDPRPWDRDLIVPVAQTTPESDVRLSALAGNSSYRLG